MKYRIAIAGSTKNTVLMAEAIKLSSNFEITYTLSPAPKLIGRKQILTQNPLHLWSLEKQLPAFLVEGKIEKSSIEDFQKMGDIDFLLVVDFGYLIPKWLLELPKIAPLNIHPSLLPKWRGSSPGQFCLLFQDLDDDGKKSAVTLMVMNESLDRGPFISQLLFDLQENWTQKEYYEHAFALIGAKLTELISDFAQGKIQAKEQTEESPTIIARRLNKQDSFVDWMELQKLMNGKKADKTKILANLLTEHQLFQDKISQIKLMVNACKAFSPWPSLWTTVTTNNGEKRMKILSCHLEKEALVLDSVQIEGKNPSSWNECKNSVKN